MPSGLFRFLRAVGRTTVISLILWSNTLLLLAVFSGYVLSRVNLKKYWIWAYWISPMLYAQNGIAVNEFLGKSWCHVLPNATEPLGVTILKSQGLFPEAYWYCLSVGALIGFTIFFNVLYTLVLTFLHPIGKFQAVVPEDSEKDKQDVGVGSIEQNMKQRGKALPFERHIITFNDIRYSIDMPKAMRKQVADEKLELLKGVTGAFRPGVLTALMGMSGAGKTTLLDVLAGRKTGGCIEGDIRIFGYPKRQETFARISGYCEQNDILWFTQHGSDCLQRLIGKLGSCC